MSCVILSVRMKQKSRADIYLSVKGKAESCLKKKKVVGFI